MMGEGRPVMAFDVETSGEDPLFALQPWRARQGTGWITTAASSMRWGNGTLDVGKIRPTTADLRRLLTTARDLNAYVVVWNGTFDLAWLLAYGLEDLVHEIDWVDAMNMWKHLDISSSYGTADHTYALKGERGAAGVFLPASVGREEDVDYHSTDPAELKKLLAYNKDDTRDTLFVAEMIWARLTMQQRKAFMIECSSMAAIAAANLEGMTVNRRAVVNLNDRLLADADRLRQQLAPFGVTDKVIRSPMQLAKVVYEEWGLPITKRGKATAKNPLGAPSTDKDTLTELVVDDDRAALLLQFREALGLRSKFIGAIAKSVTYNGDRMTRPQAKIFGTYTGRLTYASTVGKNKAEQHIGFALHQMKRDKDFRNMILAPEGYDLVEFDAAGQEFRWMAIQANDETMLMLCQPGEDAHSYMGAQIGQRDYYDVRAAVKAGEDWAKRMRQGGKVGNLSLQYRTSPRTFRIRARTDHGMKITAAESAQICKTYLRSYPGVPRYWEAQIRKGPRLGYAETLAGRRVQVKGSWTGAMQWPMESTMINYPVQGTGGDQKYLAMQVLKGLLAKYDARFAWDLHDGIYFYVPSAKSLKFAVELRAELGRLPYKEAWGFTPPIPLPWDAKIGPSWGLLKELKD